MKSEILVSSKVRAGAAPVPDPEGSAVIGEARRDLSQAYLSTNCRRAISIGASLINPPLTRRAAALTPLMIPRLSRPRNRVCGVKLDYLIEHTLAHPEYAFRVALRALAQSFALFYRLR